MHLPLQQEPEVDHSSEVLGSNEEVLEDVGQFDLANHQGAPLSKEVEG